MMLWVDVCFHVIWMHWLTAASEVSVLKSELSVCVFEMCEGQHHSHQPFSPLNSLGTNCYGRKHLERSHIKQATPQVKVHPFFSRFLVILQSAAQFWLYSGVYNFETDNGPERRHHRMPESSAPDAEEMGKAIEATGHIWSFRPCPKHSRGRHWGRDEALRHHVSQRQKISVFTTDRSVSAVHHIELLCDCLPFNLPWICNWTGNNIQEVELEWLFSCCSVKLTLIV